MTRPIQQLAVLMVLVLFGQARAEQPENQPPPIERVTSLVAQLADERFERREEAHRALKEMGKGLLAVLEKIEPPEDYEARWRLNSITEVFRRDPLIGTSWHFTYSKEVKLDDEVFTLLKGGRLHTTGNSNQTPHDDFWENIGTTEVAIRLRLNNYATYDAVRVDNNMMHGKAHNITGTKWTFKATRVATPDGVATGGKRAVTPPVVDADDPFGGF